MSIKPLKPSNHHPLLSPYSPTFNLSQHRCLFNESLLHIRSPKDRSFSFSISPSNEYLGLLSFRMDWLDLLAVQGTLNSLLQHHSWKASILWHSACFIVQLSYPYVTTGKTIALTKWIFVGKVMSLFDMLSRWVIAFVPRISLFWFHGCNHLQWFWSPARIKSLSVPIVSLSICQKR